MMRHQAALKEHSGFRMEIRLKGSEVEGGGVDGQKW